MLDAGPNSPVALCSLCLPVDVDSSVIHSTVMNEVGTL